MISHKHQNSIVFAKSEKLKVAPDPFINKAKYLKKNEKKKK